jgi:hypothetical protein
MTAEEQIAAALSGVFVEYVGKEPVERKAFNNPRNIELAKVCRDMSKHQKIVPAAMAEPSEALSIYATEPLPWPLPGRVTEQVKPAETFPVPVQPKLREILDAVVAETRTGALSILSPRRYASIVRARMIFLYAAKTLTAKSYPQIGSFVKRDHSTVHHAVQTVLASPEKFQPELDRVIARLGVTPK